MAIVAYVGLPGSGKSYGVVEHQVLPALRRGRRVVTNIPLQLDALQRDFPGADIIQLDNDSLQQKGFFASPQLHGSIVILDELSRLWPAGLRQNVADLQQRTFLTEHRHLVDAQGNSTQVVLVTQDLSQIASWVRCLVETTYHAVKLRALGAPKSYRIDVYNGAVTGQSPPQTKRTNSLYGRYQPTIYRYYQSATKSATGSVGDETPQDKRGVIWRNPAVIASLLAPLVVLPFAVWHIVGFFTPDAPPPQVEQKPAKLTEAERNERYRQEMIQMIRKANEEADRAKQLPPKPDQAERQPQPEPDPPAESIRWRLSALIEMDGKRVALLDTDFGVKRQVDNPDCQGHNLWQAQCLVDGEIVAAWTGRHLTRLARVPSHDGKVPQ